MSYLQADLLKSVAHPVRDHALQFIEMSFEKVTGAFNDCKLDGSVLLKLADEFLKLFHIPKLILIALIEQYGVKTVCKKTEIVFVDRRADAYQVSNAVVRYANFQSNTSAEREATNGDGPIGIVGFEIIQTGTNVIELSAPLVIGAAALAHTAKVYSQRN